MMITNSKAWCFVKQTTRQSLPWSIYCFSMEGKRQRKRKSRPWRVVGEGMGTAHWFPWHQLNVQCNNSLDCYFPSGRIDLCHLKSVFNLKLFLLQRLKCYFVNPSGHSLTSDTFISIRKVRKAHEGIDERLALDTGVAQASCTPVVTDQGFPKSVGPQAGLPAGLSWDGDQCHGDMTVVCHSTVTVLSCVFHHHSQPATRAGYSIAACSWKHLAFPQHWKQGYKGDRGYFGKKPSGLHQLQLVPTRTELKVNWHQLNLLTLN